MIKQPNIVSDNESSELIENEDDEELEITTEQYLQRTNDILRKLKQYLVNNNSTVQILFKDAAYEAQLEDDETITRVQIIDLKKFVPILEQIGINIDKIDLYCIFSKLKIVDEVEAISLVTLIKEIENFDLGTVNNNSSSSRVKRSNVVGESFEKTGELFNSVKNIDNVFDNNLEHNFNNNENNTESKKKSKNSINFNLYIYNF